MALKVKKRIIFGKLSQDSLSSGNDINIPLIPKLQRLRNFLKEWALCDQNFPRMRTLTREHYFKLFNEGPPEEQPIELIKLKICYELVKRDYQESGLPLPEKTLQNIKASRLFNIEKLTPSMQKLIKIQLNQGEKEMAKKQESKANGKSTRTDVAYYYLQIFENQPKSCLTDIEIVDIIKSKTGATPTLKNVASYRCMYNAGKISGQSARPKEKIKAIRVKKVETKKAETKKSPKKKLVLKKKSK